MKRTTKKCVKKAPATVVGGDDEASLSAYFAEQDQLLLPMLELIDSGKQTIAAVMNEAPDEMSHALRRYPAAQRRCGRYRGARRNRSRAGSNAAGDYRCGRNPERPAG